MYSNVISINFWYSPIENTTQKRTNNYYVKLKITGFLDYLRASKDTREIGRCKREDIEVCCCRVAEILNCFLTQVVDEERSLLTHITLKAKQCAVCYNSL